MQNKNVLVVSAHTADWLWRSGGTIARYVESGANVHIVCLTYGARGESNELWKTEGQTMENVIQIRREETLAAAEVIGVKNIEFWGYDDHMFEINPERLERMMVKIRELRPDIVLTHDQSDILNPDHGTVSEFVLLAGRMANSAGILTPGLKTAPHMAIYGFEMSNSEVNNYKPGVFVDITDVWEKKLAAMNCIGAQKATVAVHVRLNTHRGWQARGVSRVKECKFAEAFSVRFPIVCNELPWLG